MRKTLRRNLRIKGHKFYLSPTELNYFSKEETLSRSTKVKTKKRMKELTESIQFINDVNAIQTFHKKNYTVIYRSRQNEKS